MNKPLNSSWGGDVRLSGCCRQPAPACSRIAQKTPAIPRDSFISSIGWDLIIPVIRLITFLEANAHYFQEWPDIVRLMRRRQKERVLGWQTTGPNQLYLRDDLVDRPRTMGVWIPTFQIASYLPSYSTSRRVTPNRPFQFPWFVPELAGFRRPAVQSRGLEKDGLIRLWGLVVRQMRYHTATGCDGIVCRMQTTLLSPYP